MVVKNQCFAVCGSACFGGLYRTIRDYKGFLKSPLGLCNGPWAALRVVRAIVPFRVALLLYYNYAFTFKDKF